jgi:hypothetical protein
MNRHGRSAHELGQRVATVLSGSWRSIAPDIDPVPQDWDRTVTRLMETGGGGLGWWRIRESNLRHLTSSGRLRNALRLQALNACLHEQRIAAVAEYCRAAGVEPLFAKGWAISRLYPEAGLRPCGDIDLFVRPEENARLQTSGAGALAERFAVDLHSGFPDLNDRSLEEIFARSRVQRCGERSVSVPGPEDQLRHLCVHLMRHGAWRPLWLVDVAVAVESIGRDFDWNYFLHGSRQRTRAVACAVGLAQRLLDARVENTPLAECAESLPRWLVPAVLSQWGVRYQRFTDAPLATILPRPRDILPALRRRWPNPIESTMFLRAPLDGLPRPPLQLADCLVRLVAFAYHLPRDWRLTRSPATLSDRM